MHPAGDTCSAGPTVVCCLLLPLPRASATHDASAPTVLRQSNAVVLSPTEYKLSVSSASSATEAASGVAPSRLVAPSLQLLGHKGTCHSLAFSHQGDRLAVACADGHVYLWTFLDEDPKNYDDLPIHTNDVLQVSESCRCAHFP